VTLKLQLRRVAQLQLEHRDFFNFNYGIAVKK
jgi:hypothetical protein